MLPFFRKLERFTRPTDSQTLSGVRFDEHVHGTGDDHGRVKVGYPNYFYEQSEMWHNASGLSPSPDLSNGSPQGTVGIAPNSLDAQSNTRRVRTLAFPLPALSSLIRHLLSLLDALQSVLITPRFRTGPILRF